MAWSSDEIDRLRQMQGTYPLPGGCWATLKVKDGPSGARDPDAWPEGVEYAWAILMPGEPPKLRGDRMAGVDNADDASVRNQILAEPTLGRHRAHRHRPDWKNTKAASGEEWPLAGKGAQLASAPANPAELWKLCVECLEDLFGELGLDLPSEVELLQSRMDEEDFRTLQGASRTQVKAGGPAL